MKVREIEGALREIAPPELAAEWDNVGLLVGDGDAVVEKLLLCIDLTEAVLAEARKRKVGMVMAYHPPIFKPLSRLTRDAAPVVYGALAGGVAVYSMHTALDAAPGGTNDVLAEVLQIAEPRPLEPTLRESDFKLVVFTPAEDVSTVADAAFDAGAGHIGDYRRCAFFGHGVGTFRGGEGTNPAVGSAGRQEAVEELRLEMVCPPSRVAGVCAAIREAHPYEEPAIDVIPRRECVADTGMGRVGRLRRAVTLDTLVRRIKKQLGVSKVLLAGPGDGKDRGRMIRAAACCAGSCGSMWKSASSAGAGLYFTGEMRHHDALAAGAAGLNVVCVNHSNSERITLERLRERLAQSLPQIRCELSRADRDPFEIV